jgi:hypothetical protein
VDKDQLICPFANVRQAKFESLCTVVSFKSTRKRTNRLQYSMCKCEVESTGNCVAKINLYLN